MKRRCICPGCKKQSRGPRFHYLCEDHTSEPKKSWLEWQEQSKAKRKPPAKRKPAVKRAKSAKTPAACST